MINQMTNQEELLERLASIEHEQWREWSQQIATEERISEERAARWCDLWRPYSALPEDSKEQDRVWARKVLDLLSDFYAKRHRIHEGDLVEIAWYDASYDDKIRTSILAQIPDPEVHLSWGQVLGWTERYLRILQTRSTDESDGNTVMLIPWGMVDKVTIIRLQADSQNRVKCENNPGEKT